MKYWISPTNVFLALFFTVSSCYYSEDIPRQPDLSVCLGTNLLVSATPTQTSGCGQSDGSIVASATGGSGSYMFSKDGGVTKQSSGTFPGLAGGSYQITVYDGNLCSNSTQVDVSNANSTFQASVQTVTNADCLTGSGGSVQLQASGASGAVTYKVGTATNSTGIFSSLAPGSYQATVSDASCSLGVGFTIATTSSVSYVNDVVPFMTTYCSFPSPCHNSNLRANLSVYDDPNSTNDVKGWAADIKIKISGVNPSMPKAPKPGGTPTANEVKAIICWIDDGAKNN